MNTKEQASQLRLAADILETGHPFLVSHIPHGIWCAPVEHQNSVIHWPLAKYQFKIILATPPDNRPLHNPDNLTADQVGVGYRLPLVGEPAHPDTEAFRVYNRDPWERIPSRFVGTRIGVDNGQGVSLRLPLSVPWPALPIAELPKSLVELDAEQHAAVDAVLKETIHDPYAELKAAHAAGKVIQTNGYGDWLDLKDGNDMVRVPIKNLRIKPEPVDLGPEDCPPNSVFRSPEWKPSIYVTPSLVAQDGVTWIRKLMNSASASVEYLSFAMLKDAGWLINRPANRDADGYPTKWEKCSKEVPA